MAIYSGSGILKNNIFLNNTADNCGGGLYFNGSNSTFLVVNNLFAKNTRNAIYAVQTDSVKFINNTIANNSGYGIASESKILLFINCILWNNSSGSISGLFQYTNSIIEELQTTNDPLFIDPPGNEWTLKINSPCINAGTTDTTGLYLPAIDLAGNPRISDTIIDIGAYEFQKINLIPENNRNNVLNIYPNPAEDKITIEEVQFLKETLLIIYNSTGQELLLKQLKESKTQIDISHFPDGVYIVKIINDRGIKYGKINKRKS